MPTVTRTIVSLLALFLFAPAWAGESIPGTVEECIDEPVFEGRVCTVQANPGAAVGVILVHGLNGSVAHDWRHTIPALAPHFHVVAFDLPGFGKSDKESKLYSPTHYARLVRFLADHYLTDKPYHVVGHSLGGAVSLRFAAEQPLRLQRLVLADAAGILHPLALTKFQAGAWVERVTGSERPRGFAERLAGKLLEEVERLPISPTDLADTRRGRDTVLRGSPPEIAALALAGEDFSQAIATTSVPTLILWGDRDPVTPLRTGRVLAARMPQARLEIIHGAAHVPMLEQAERFNTLVSDYLRAPDQHLAAQFRPGTRSFTPVNSERTARCDGESGRMFEGEYDTIELRNCRDVVIRNTQLRHLYSFESRVEVTDTVITAAAVGLHAIGSDITMTNSDISGEIAIGASRSRFDLAGVHLTGSQAAITSGLTSKVIFSVSRVESPHYSGFIHDFRNIGNDRL